MAILGAAAFAAVFYALPETLRQRGVEPLTLGGILTSFRHVSANARFRVYASVLGLAYMGLFTYIGVSSFIVQDFYGLSPIAYGLNFALGGGFFIGGTFLGRRVAQRAGLDAAIGVGVALLAIGGVVAPFAVAFGPHHIVSFFVPMAIFHAGIGVTTPQALAAAMTPFPDRAGAASSLAGFIQMAGAAVLLGFTGSVFGDSAALQAAVVGAAGLAAFAVYVGFPRARYS
jgi:DHA1 family bicyclomycin/chloramphenicol resistance-like MFS transporter